MARTRARAVVLTDEQRVMLSRVARSRTEEVRRVQRAKVVLMAADGDTDKGIGEAVGLGRASVHQVLRKFHAMGVEAALRDLARPGKPRVISDADRAWVVSQACMKPTEVGLAQELWTISALTRHIRGHAAQAGHPSLAGVAQSKVWTILDDEELKPHRIRYYLERRDPDFDQKMEKVLMVYKRIELELEQDQPSGVVTVSFDEKPGIQALAPLSPDLRPVPGVHAGVGRDYEYRRLGTVSLLAGLNLVTGEVTGLVRDTHTSQDFTDFLEIIDKRYADACVIRVVLDNHSTHTSRKTLDWLDAHPGRFEFVFTPVHGSWLNLVESFFGKLARVCLKGIRVHSKPELVERIYRYLDEVNAAPVVYHWKYKMDDIVL